MHSLYLSGRTVYSGEFRGKATAMNFIIHCLPPLQCVLLGDLTSLQLAVMGLDWHSVGET